MTWSKFDDGYDEHEKVEEAWDADRATIGLHVMATTACNRWLSDGVIRPKWLRHKLPGKRERERVLASMVSAELLDVLRAGEQLVVHDSDDNSITLGPFSEDRYLVHDFLDRHDSSVQVKAKRRRDADRKAMSRRSPVGVRADKPRTPTGQTADSERSPGASRGHARGGAGAPPDPTRPNNPPNPPGGEASDLDAARERLRLAAPARPAGGRQRDEQHWREQFAAWSHQHFPDAEPQGVSTVVDWVRNQRIDPTPDAVREFVTAAPNFAYLLEPAA